MRKPAFGASPFSLTITRSGTNVVVSFPTEASFSYQLQSATNLLTSNWLAVGPPFPGTGGVLSTNVPIGPEPKKFFRLLNNN